MDNREVFIVGGSSGIGEATAKKFISEGYAVMNMSRTPCKVAGVGNILCDVSDKDALDEALKGYTKNHGKLSVLVYSAGASMAAPLEHVRQEDYRYLFEVNLFGFMKVLQELLPLLRNAGGVACAVSSIGGITPIAYDSYYSSSKAALNMFVNALQLELLDKGVKVISVMPGGTKTRFTYKRKIYSCDIVGDYDKDMFDAVKALHNVEQNGMKAEKVAETIYRKCTSQVLSHTFASGVMNKLIAFSLRLLPQAVGTWIGKKIYFGK